MKLNAAIRKGWKVFVIIIGLCDQNVKVETIRKLCLYYEFSAIINELLRKKAAFCANGPDKKRVMINSYLHSVRTNAGTLSQPGSGLVFSASAGSGVFSAPEPL